jgi:alkylhydroperoxidase family enzyme
MTETSRLPRPPNGDSPGSVYDPALLDALDQYQATVMQLKGLDAVTTELVRLHCANHHNCRVCRSLRLASAREIGVDETMAGKVLDFERSDLSERHKVALRFADAHLSAPAHVSPELHASLHAHFSTAEIAEIAFDVSKWSYQKGLVALGLDAPRPDGASPLFDFDESGRAVYG